MHGWKARRAKPSSKMGPLPAQYPELVSRDQTQHNEAGDNLIMKLDLGRVYTRNLRLGQNEGQIWISGSESVGET